MPVAERIALLVNSAPMPAGSSTLPMVNPPQGSLAGSYNIVISKLDVSGTILLYSTYLGGPGYESVFGGVVGSDGSLYLGAKTLTSAFP